MATPKFQRVHLEPAATPYVLPPDPAKGRRKWILHGTDPVVGYCTMLLTSEQLVDLAEKIIAGLNHEQQLVEDEVVLDQLARWAEQH